MRWISLQQSGSRLRNTVRLLSLFAIAVLVLAGSLTAQAKRYPLDSTTGLRLHNVVAEPAVLQGKKGVRITSSEETRRRVQSMAPNEQLLFPQLASIEGLEFANGMIEAEIAGAQAPDAGEAARGYVGIAFRVQNDGTTYDAFYLRPQMVAPTIKSGGITRSSTSHTPIGHFFGYGRRPPPNTNRTST